MIHNQFSDNDLLFKIKSLETEIQICNTNVTICESKVAKEKKAQKQKNQRLMKIIADTRKNNGNLKAQLSQYQRGNLNDINHQNEMDQLKTSVANLQKQNRELKINMEKLAEERDAEIKKNYQCQSKIIPYLEMTQELQSKQSKLTADLERCNEELEAELKKNLLCEKKLQLVCPVWSEWSDCSKTCPRVKTRTDKCSMHDNETKPCGENCKGTKSAGSRLLQCLFYF